MAWSSLVGLRFSRLVAKRSLSIPAEFDSRVGTNELTRAVGGDACPFITLQQQI